MYIEGISCCCLPCLLPNASCVTSRSKERPDDNSIIAVRPGHAVIAGADAVDGRGLAKALMGLTAMVRIEEDRDERLFNS